MSDNSPVVSSYVGVFTDTISGFQAGDAITIEVQNSGEVTSAFPSPSWNQATDTLDIYEASREFGSTGKPLLVATLTLEGSYTAASFSLSKPIVNDNTDNTTVTLTTNAVPGGPQAYLLGTTPAYIAAGAGNDIFTAVAGGLVAGDHLDGGGGINTLVLSGAGSFDLSAPTTLANTGLLQATEAQPASGGTASQQQAVILRAGLDLTVQVASAANQPGTAGITILGATNADVIDLGAGADTVLLGTGETVHGGTGHDLLIVSAATIGDTIEGGTGGSTLGVEGGGTLAMGANITDIAQVLLVAAASGSTQPAYMFTANAEAGLQITGSGGADTITLGGVEQGVNANGGAVHILSSAADATGSIIGAAGAVLEITSGSSLVLNATDASLTVRLDTAGSLVLNAQSSLSAVGSDGRDQLVAGGSGQTLTGGLGKDVLVGSAAYGDVFADVAAGLKGDTIQDFGGSDVIDITDFAFGANVTELYRGNASHGMLTVADAGHKVAIELTGSFTTASFSLSSDGHGGLHVGLHG